MSDIHDDLCLTNHGGRCNCPTAAWPAGRPEHLAPGVENAAVRRLQLSDLYHSQAMGYRGPPLAKLSRDADARARVTAIVDSVFRWLGW